MSCSHSFGTVTRLLGATGLLLLGCSQLALSAPSRLPGLVDKPVPELPAPVKAAPVGQGKKKGPGKFKAPANGDEAFAHVDRIVFDGDLIVGMDKLNRVVAPYLGRDLTRYDLARLKYELTALHYHEGYPLVKVTTPPQKVEGGVLKVNILMGRIGILDIENKSRLRPAIANAMTWRLHHLAPFAESTAESVVQDINDLGNLKGRLNLRRGRQPGTTDLRLFIEDVAEDRQNVYVDNYGSELTGRWVATGDFRKSNLLGLGETIGLNVRKSNKDLKSIQLSVSTPIGLHNVKLEGRVLHSENEIGDRLAALQASGKTDVYDLGLSSALINTVQYHSVVRAGISHRKHRSYLAKVLDTNDKITQVYLESSLIKRSTRYVLYGNVRVSKGVGLLDGNGKGAANATRATGNPHAWILDFDGVARYQVTPRDVLTAVVRAQKASDDLLSSDLFAVGGYGSVRGFEPAETTGEHGLTLSVDYAHQMQIADGWRGKGGPFLDAGWVKNNIANAVSDSRLVAAGLGVELSRDWTASSVTRLRLDWAHPLGSYQSVTVRDNSFYLRLQQTF
jgi:hemolysin activation/secretion protein